MIILCVNSGSSSLKFKLFNYETQEDLATGIVERIGLASFIKFDCLSGKHKIDHSCPTHTEAIQLTLNTMVDPKFGILKSMNEISAVGHRIVHGGEKVTHSCMINDKTIEDFKSLYDLSPLHNPANVLGIEAVREILPNVPHVAILDTAWHKTMPDYVYTYPLPHEWKEKYGVRRYGFHGTSHLYVSRRASVLMGKKPSESRIIVLHIGNGSSANAIKYGKSYDTSMGMTPLEGLMMGTRSGDFDPAISFFIMEKENLTPSALYDILNKKSGCVGVTKQYSDRLDIEIAAEKGDELCNLNIEMESYRLKKYIGSYMAAMGGCDAIVFTAGVGEMGPITREKAVDDMEDLGIKLDKDKNNKLKNRNGEFEISTPDSKIKIYVIPTDEEAVFIEDVAAIVNGTYKEPEFFEYPFQKKEYVNKQRAAAFEEDCVKKPYLRDIAVKPK